MQSSMPPIGAIAPTGAIVGTSAVLGLVAAVLVFGVLHMKRVRTNWSRTAARRGWTGLDDVRSSLGGWSASMRGLAHGTSVVVEGITRRRGKHSSTHTRVSAALRQPLGARVRIEPRAWWIFSRPVRMPSVEIGGALGEKLRVHSDDANVARSVVTSAFLWEWERLGRSAVLDIGHGVAVLEWNGIDADEQVIERAIDLVAGIARETRDAREPQRAAARDVRSVA
jgi:hypothetical protein